MIEKTSCGEASFGVQRPLFNGRLEKWSDVDTAPCSRRSLQSWGHWFMLENRGTSTVVGQGHSSAASNGTLSRHPSSFAARSPIANRSPARAGNKRLLLPSLETPAFEIKPTAAAFGWQTWWWRLFWRTNDGSACSRQSFSASTPCPHVAPLHQFTDHYGPSNCTDAMVTAIETTRHSLFRRFLEPCRHHGIRTRWSEPARWDRRLFIAWVACGVDAPYNT